MFRNSRQRLKYSRDFFWTKWRCACYVIIILLSPKQKLYWVEFQRRFEVLLWSCWTNFEIKRSKCIVFLFYWVVLFTRHYFLKISFFHLTSPLNGRNWKKKLVPARVLCLLLINLFLYPLNLVGNSATTGGIIFLNIYTFSTHLYFVASGELWIFQNVFKKI